MTDGPTIGHNKPPSEMEIAVETFDRNMQPYRERCDELVQKGRTSTVSSEDSSASAIDLVKALRRAITQVKLAYDATVAPLDEALKAVRAMRDKEVNALTVAKTRMETEIHRFDQERRRREDEERRKAHEAAAEEARQRRMLEPEVVHDDKPEEPAYIPPTKALEGNYGAKAITQSRRVPVIVDTMKALMHFRRDPSILAALEKCCRAAARSQTPVPGVEFHEDEKVVIR